jgi:CrcB protein
MPQRWTTARVFAVASGGAVGAGLRWAAIAAWPVGPGFPWVVLLVNCGGSFLLGALLAEEWGHPRARLLLHDAGGIGFCGGLTTFSTYAVEVVDLLDRHRVALAVTYTLASVAGALAAVVAGAASLRRVRALITPVET